jgi:hypothetical protein
VGRHPLEIGLHPWPTLESSDAVQFYARNDHMGLTIPYEYMGIDHAYEPDFLVRLSNGVIVVLEHRSRAVGH